MKPYLSLGEAIEAYLKKNGLTEEAAIQKVIAEWDVLMGKAIAHTRSIHSNSTDWKRYFGPRKEWHW